MVVSGSPSLLMAPPGSSLAVHRSCYPWLLLVSLRSPWPLFDRSTKITLIFFSVWAFAFWTGQGKSGEKPRRTWRSQEEQEFFLAPPSSPWLLLAPPVSSWLLLASFGCSWEEPGRARNSQEVWRRISKAEPASNHKMFPGE